MEQHGRVPNVNGQVAPAHRGLHTRVGVLYCRSLPPSTEPRTTSEPKEARNLTTIFLVGLPMSGAKPGLFGEWREDEPEASRCTSPGCDFRAAEERIPGKPGDVPDILRITCKSIGTTADEVAAKA